MGHSFQFVDDFGTTLKEDAPAPGDGGWRYQGQPQSDQPAYPVPAQQSGEADAQGRPQLAGDRGRYRNDAETAQDGRGGARRAGQQWGAAPAPAAEKLPPNAPFTPGPLLNIVGRDRYQDGVVAGMVDPETFKADLDIPFRQGSFELGVPEYGGFTPEQGGQASGPDVATPQPATAYGVWVTDLEGRSKALTGLSKDQVTPGLVELQQQVESSMMPKVTVSNSTNSGRLFATSSSPSVGQAPTDEQRAAFIQRMRESGGFGGGGTESLNLAEHDVEDLNVNGSLLGQPQAGSQYGEVAGREFFKRGEFLYFEGEEQPQIAGVTPVARGKAKAWRAPASALGWSSMHLSWVDGIAPQAPGTEAYAPIQENEFLTVRDAPLSTFGLDVDTASYANVRRFLMEAGRFPPPDAVRIEELVNYFTYADAEPVDDEPLKPSRWKRPPAPGTPSTGSSASA